MAPDLNCSSPTDEMRGYLRKSRKWNKRFFVLREGPPPRLEYYDSEKKCGAKGKPKRSIDLENVWNIDKKVSTKHKFLIGVYTEQEYFAMSADNLELQEMWVNALQKAVINYKGQNNQPHCMYKHIWQGQVDTRDLEHCNSNTRINLQGAHRCCLTDNTMVLIRLNSAGGSDLMSHTHVEIAIASIRSCGHKDNLFFMEPGRSSGIGTGKLWMELDDAAIADNMHTTILKFMYSLGQENRPRSYSSGSGSSRTNVRSRHYFNPPPSQVGMRPSMSTTPTGPIPNLSSLVRSRCESFPTPQVTGLSDEARYRTSSEGETTMKRPYPFYSLNRKAGSVSPHTRSRVWSSGRRPLHLQPPFHFRTSSLPGSNTGTSSSNSSNEHLNVNHDCISSMTNGQSPAMSEGNHSSDEFSSSPMTDHNSHIQHYISPHLSRSSTPPPYSHTPPGYDYGHRASFQLHLSPFPNMEGEQIPQPPQVAPLVPPVTAAAASTTQHDYVNVKPAHSRSHSLDDNLSCDTGASSLSTSPQISGYLANVSASPDVGYMYSQSPSQCSTHSQCSDFSLLYTPTSTSPNGADADEYAIVGYGGADTYPHQSLPTSPPSSDYTLMNLGKGSANGGPVESKSGYVPMRPLARSSPQDIGPKRRRSFSDHRMVNGSYSPASPLSRSPDKVMHHMTRAAASNHCVRCKKTDIPHSFPCHCSTLTVTASHPPIPPVSCHGLKVEPKNDFSQDNNRPISSTSTKPRLSESPPFNNSDDYACMNGITRTLEELHIKQTNSKPIKSPTASQDCRQPSESPSSGGLDNEYLPMHPMNMSNGRKSVVGAVLSVAESGTGSSSTLPAPQYPHQLSVSKSSTLNYSTNSLDRSKHTSRKRATSLVFSKNIVGSKHNSGSRKSKHGRKTSLKLTVDAKSASSESKNSGGNPPLSPGGEYVSIDYDKAKKQQAGLPYVRLTSEGASGEPDISSESNRLPGTPKPVHDSNRNLLPTKQSPPKDEYMSLKPGETISGS